MKVVFDFDATKYLIASSGEEREIEVTHTSSGKKKLFKTRTEFYGHHSKKAGGWLAEKNLTREMEGKTPFPVTDFEIKDIQTPQLLEFALGSVKAHIFNIVEYLGATGYYGYIGKGDSWRVEASTLIKYKGNRDNMLRPLLLQEVEDYLILHHNARTVRGLEADDQLVMDCIKNPELVLVGVDKDYFGCPLNFYIHGKMDKPQKIEGFGELYINEKNVVKGHGYLWWLFQVLSGDQADNYFANSASDIKWGEKSAYKLLVDCKNEKEAWEAVIGGYKKLYPEPKMFTGWRGDVFEIDWKYVLNENCVMSKMMEHENYKFNLDVELDKFGVKNGN